MPAPIQGAQVAQQAQQTNQKETQLTKAQDSKFDGVMAQKAQQAHATQAMQQVSQAQKAQQVSQAQKVTDVAKAEKAQVNKASTATKNAVEQPKQADAQNSTGKSEQKPTLLMKMVGDLEHGQSNMDKMIQMAIGGNGGHKMDFQQMTALQMQVYQYSQEMELTSKVVEKATSGLKDTLKTQV